jgi:hypothetical protein
MNEPSNFMIRIPKTKPCKFEWKNDKLHCKEHDDFNIHLSKMPSTLALPDSFFMNCASFEIELNRESQEGS